MKKYINPVKDLFSANKSANHKQLTKEKKAAEAVYRASSWASAFKANKTSISMVEHWINEYESFSR